jgi:hypothetical protein
LLSVELFAEELVEATLKAQARITLHDVLRASGRHVMDRRGVASSRLRRAFRLEN